MMFTEIHLADILANDPDVELLDDRRAELGYVTVLCPFDDATDNHLLHVYNPQPHGAVPAMIFCLNEKCSHVTTAEFIELLGTMPSDIS